ncbi:MAG: DUF6932 family protein [Microcystaceae cyanobacterium]
MAIPSFDTNGNLPAGIHLATWQEIEEILAFNPRRQELLSGLKRACKSLKQVGCLCIYIGGSFVTNKEFPGDFDVCWADETVDLEQLEKIDPVLLDLTKKRAAQKAKYGGEFFPANLTEGGSMKKYLDFLQTHRNGEPKGIVAVEL